MSDLGQNSLCDRLAAIIGQELERPDLAVTPETLFDDVPGWDSLVMTGVLIEIEKQTGTRIPRSEAAECRSVAELVALIRHSG